MSIKSDKRRTTKIGRQMEKRRALLWPDVSEQMLWSAEAGKVGYAQIPRAFPVIQSIMDSLSGKGAPLSKTYLVLWFRVFDQSVVTIDDTSEVARESGFGSQRNESTWRDRMEKLEELGFIKCGPHGLNRYKYVLILNPYLVIRRLFEEKKIQKDQYVQLWDRAQRIGATDLDDSIELKKEPDHAVDELERATVKGDGAKPGLRTENAVQEAIAATVPG